MTQIEFETKWHRKWVELKPDSIFQLPKVKYFVTAALLNCCGELVFAIEAEDYTVENKHWFTMKFDMDNWKAIDDNFVVINLESDYPINPFSETLKTIDKYFDNLVKQ